VLRAARIVPEADPPAPITAQIETGTPVRDLGALVERPVLSPLSGAHLDRIWTVPGSQQETSVRIARMSADGTLLDPMGIDVLTLAPKGEMWG
jgi:hypothetical protein